MSRHPDPEELRATSLNTLKVMHRRYLATILSSDKDKDLIARKLRECEDVADRLSSILKEETTVKMVMDWIDCAFEDAPATLSFLTCVVIKFAFNLPRANFPEVLRYIEDGKGIKNKGEDPSGSWSHYFTFVKTLREELEDAEDVDSWEQKDICSTEDFDKKEEVHVDFIKRQTESISQPLTRRRAERLVFNFVSSTLSDRIVTWVNKEKESGEPYDVLIKAEDSRFLYIEVNASAGDKDGFFLSPSEYAFALKNGNDFMVADVFPEGDVLRIRILRNPVKNMNLALHPKRDHDIDR